MIQHQVSSQADVKTLDDSEAFYFAAAKQKGMLEVSNTPSQQIKLLSRDR